MNIGTKSAIHFNELAGVGCDHAKFQPGLCWYRMLPEIELTREVEGKQADLLQTCFSPGVIDVITTSEGKGLNSFWGLLSR